MDNVLNQIGIENYIFLSVILFSIGVFVVFSMAVAAAEVAVGLAILVAVLREIVSIDVANLKNLKG